MVRPWKDPWGLSLGLRPFGSLDHPNKFLWLLLTRGTTSVVV